MGAEEVAVNPNGECVGAEALSAIEPAAYHVGDQADPGGGEGLGGGKVEVDAGDGSAGSEVFFEVGDGFVGGHIADGAGVDASEVVVVIASVGAAGCGDGSVDVIAKLVWVFVDGTERPGKVEGNGLRDGPEEEQKADEGELRIGVTTRHLVIIIDSTKKCNLCDRVWIGKGGCVD